MNTAPAALADTAARFSAIRRDFDLYRLLSPASREQVEAEKRAFFDARAAGRVANPRFDYPPLDRAALDEASAWLEGLALGEGSEAAGRSVAGDGDPLERLLAEERDTLLLHLETLRRRAGDPAAFAEIAVRAFGRPTDDDLRAARDAIANTAPRERQQWRPAEELAAMARAHLDAFGLANWRVEIEPHLLSVLKVETANRLVQLKAGVEFDELDVVSLLRHEIEGHAVRAENGYRLGHAFLGTGVGDETELDEGIAVYLEEKHGGFVGRRRLEVCARVVAADLALRGDFASAYDELEALAPAIGRDLLFQMVARVKRGLADSAAPGGWPKDALYYAGYRKVAKLMRDSPDPDATWRRLMTARVSWKGLDAAEALARAAA